MSQHGARAPIPVMKPLLGREEAEAAAETVASGWVAQGPRVAEFESALAERVGAAHGVAVTSCTTALHLALVVVGLGPGDEVVVPSLSFIATANCARYQGAEPVFADVDAATQNLTAETIEPVLTPATRAVILVHQGGMPADIDSVHKLCSARGMAVVEDAACALGSTYKGRPIGGHSELVAFSFHPRKVITTGEGGMLMASREDVATRLRQLRDHGSNVSASDRHRSRSLVVESYLETGFNYRMTDIQAAIGLVQLGRLSGIVSQRRRLASLYQESLSAIGGIEVAEDPPYGETNFQSFWIILPDDFPVSRDRLLEGLIAQGISPRRGIMASHLEPTYAGKSFGPLPVTERLSARSMILPLYHEMGETEVERVVDAISRAAGLRSQ